MPFPQKKIKINLDTATPSQLTGENLKGQLNNIGLACKDTLVPRLNQFVQDVEAVIPVGSVQSFAILQPTSDSTKKVAGLVQAYEVSATGNWISKDIGYGPQLEYLQVPAHFDWLKANRGSTFLGIANSSDQTQTNSTVDAIKSFFINTTTLASSVVLNGISHDTLEAVMSNVIAPLNDTSAENYDHSDSRVIFLVENYNPNTGYADAIGVVSVEWTLTITDYKVKKGPAGRHNSHLVVHARGIQYSDIDAFNADYNAAVAHFGPQHIAMALAAFPPKNTTLTIYPNLPAATADTYQHSLPLNATTDKLQALVLFAPDLQEIGSIDNSTSSVTTSYSKSIMTGFSFSSTQSLGITAGFEVSVEVVKASVSVNFTISFTEQYSTQTTETVQFSVPGGKKAFLYQGTIRSRILEYDPVANTYSYKEIGKFNSSIYATSDVPIVPKATVTFSVME